METKLARSEPGPPTVSVVMATFNRAHLIPESIDSILSQTRPAEEFIIVNDGSTDDTAEVVRRYGNRITYVEKPNGGKPAALNLVLPQVQSTYVWIFDDDDIALPDALEAHLKFLAEHPECDFSYSTNYEFSGVFSESALKRGRLKALPTCEGSEYFRWIMGSPLLPTLMQGMLIPTRCYRAVGGFDEDMLRCEDIDVLLRIARHFRAGCVDQPTFALRVHAGERGPAFERHADADRYRIFWQYRRKIFAKLRKSLLLEEYLPTSAVPLNGHRVLSTPETRSALLQRATVMATHALFPAAIEDFREFVNHLDSATAPSDAERRKISSLAYIYDPEMLPPAAYYRRMGTASRGSRALYWAAARGLYWTIARELRRRRFLLVLRLLGLGASLAGGYVGVPPTRKESVRGID